MHPRCERGCRSAARWSANLLQIERLPQEQEAQGAKSALQFEWTQVLCTRCRHCAIAAGVDARVRYNVANCDQPQRWDETDEREQSVCTPSSDCREVSEVQHPVC